MSFPPMVDLSSQFCSTPTKISMAFPFLSTHQCGSSVKGTGALKSVGVFALEGGELDSQVDPASHRLSDFDPLT